MANKTFNPNDFKKRAPVKEPELRPAPAVIPGAAKPKVMPVESSAAGMQSVRLIDKISLTYEPEWESILHNVGVTHS